MTTNPPNNPIGLPGTGIKTVGEEKNEAKQILFQLAADQRQQREEIDSIKVAMQQLLGKMQEIIDVQNQTSQMLSGAQQQVAAPQVPGGNMGGLMTLKDILDSKLGDKIVEKLFGSESTAPPLIDNSIIQEKMKKTFFDNLETGETINDFIKNSLKKTVTKNVINVSLKDIGRQTPIQHEPE